jgi:hypothetical protein
MNALVLVPAERETFDMTDKLLRQGDIVARAKRTRDAAVAKARTQAMPVQGNLFQTLFESVPHSFVRSALFTANRKGPRADFGSDGVKVPSFRNFEISRRGKELRQFDLEVWTKVVSLYLREFNGPAQAWPYIRFTGYAMLKALGMDANKANYKKLAGSVDALAKAGVTIIERRKGKAGKPTVINLLGRATRDDDTGQFVLEVSHSAAELFAPGNHSPLDIPAHQKLRHNPLAQWLHAHLSSHHGTFQSMKYASMRAYSGRGQQEMRKFKRDARNAMDLLVKHGRILAWQDIDGEQFSIRQPLTKKQLQALGIGATDAPPAPSSPTPTAAATSLSDGLNATQKSLFEDLASSIGILDDEGYSELRAQAVAAEMPEPVLEHFDKLMDESRF